jgi:hypothetical protein
VKETEKQIDGVCGSERKIAFGDVTPLPCVGKNWTEDGLDSGQENF